jgi:uncharacterized protein YciW
LHGTIVPLRTVGGRTTDVLLAVHRRPVPSGLHAASAAARDASEHAESYAFHAVQYARNVPASPSIVDI